MVSSYKVCENWQAEQKRKILFVSQPEEKLVLNSTVMVHQKDMCILNLEKLSIRTCILRYQLIQTQDNIIRKQVLLVLLLTVTKHSLLTVEKWKMKKIFLKQQNLGIFLIVIESYKEKLSVPHLALHHSSLKACFLLKVHFRKKHKHLIFLDRKWGSWRQRHLSKITQQARGRNRNET